MDLPEFLRAYPLRSPNIMWFLGAGASASSGIKTAYHMIWDFKARMYCSANRVSLKSLSDLGDPTTKARLQRFFDSKGDFPAEDAEDEYAAYFEKVYPDERDRRRYIDSAVSVGQPSYGYKAMAALIKSDRIRAVWSTNFDTMVEDTVIPLYGSRGKIVVATLGEPDMAVDALNEGRWPVLAKIHGDYQSRQLKNTPAELKSQDETMRFALVEACKRFGLAVIGYSGRDRSIMEVFEEAINGGRGFPGGLFWFYRSDSLPLPSVQALITRAAAAGCDAHLIAVETFDELFADIVNQIPDLPVELLANLERTPTRVTDAPVPTTEGHAPVIRLNALPITESPTMCRLVRCRIGGMSDVREAIARNGADIVAARRNVGVIAFGKNQEIRRAFGDFEIAALDYYTIEAHRLRHESAELGLLYDALACAFQRERPVAVQRWRSGHIITVDPDAASDPLFAKLHKATGGLSGTVPRTKIRWVEAVRFHLDYRLGRLWLLLEPTIWFAATDDVGANDAAKEFRRERLARRFNVGWNNVLDGWIHVVVAGRKEAELCAFGIGDGVDAAFTIQKQAAFSRRE